MFTLVPAIVTVEDNVVAPVTVDVPDTVEFPPTEEFPDNVCAAPIKLEAAVTSPLLLTDSPTTLPDAAILCDTSILPDTEKVPVTTCEPVKCLKLLSSSKFVRAEPFSDRYVNAICYYFDATTISNWDADGYAFAFIESIPTSSL